jgi:hypothetical protein
MRNYRNISLGILFFLTFIFIGGFVMFNSSQIVKVLANNTKWGNWTDTSLCIATSCGSTSGTKTQEKVCVQGGNSNVCSLAHQECEKGCPTVSWSATSQCPSGYTLSSQTCPGRCRKNGSTNPSQCVDMLAFGPITFTYEKSSDPNHCHRPTASSLSVPSWAENEFNQDNPELKNTVDVNCVNVPADKQVQTGVPCNNAPYVACAPTATPTQTPEATPTPTVTQEPTPTCEVTPTPGEEKNHNVCREDACVKVEGAGESSCDSDEDCKSEATPTPTVTQEEPTATPTQTPNQGGPGDGLSDGRSDGGSSCPDCTKAPSTQSVLGASTGPTKAVLGLSTTSGEENAGLQLIQILGALTSGAFGLSFLKKNA